MKKELIETILAKLAELTEKENQKWRRGLYTGEERDNSIKEIIETATKMIQAI